MSHDVKSNLLRLRVAERTLGRSLQRLMREPDVSSQLMLARSIASTEAVLRELETRLSCNS